MSESQDHVLHISSQGGEPLTLQLEALSPVTVRLQIDAGCTCHDGAAASRPGSYAYSDPAGRKN